ncbi:nuclear transport factor 2 family protein [Leifsonia sp. NPDC080035]|uniref:Nuclear transport factor 2 family protein n=1 Tax=Leifsonia sp. NPDC080035 TaxID=3143936 RepID=A0AAU7GH59_9MICO
MPERSYGVDPAIRTEIEQLISELLYRLDHDQADTTWELYTEDAETVGPLGPMRGRDAVKAWGAKRALQTDIVGRHFIGGIRLAWDAGVLTGTVAYLTFRDSAEDVLTPASVGEFREQYRLVDGEWRFARREIVPVFGGANAAAHARRLAEATEATETGDAR